METCTFCSRAVDEGIVLEGYNGKICKSCAKVAYEHFFPHQLEMFIGGAMSSTHPHQSTQASINQSTVNTHASMHPADIKSALDAYVIGQEEAKRMLAVASYNHYKRINHPEHTHIKKSNVLLVGPTGSGKTYLMQTLAKTLDVPIAIGDATSLTEAGYIGDDVESLLEALLQKAGGDIKKAERGIVYIDEIDKIAQKTNLERKNTRDVSGEGVQQALLKIIEDGEVSISHNRREVTLSTKNILFVGGGAFVDLLKTKQAPTKVKHPIGFTASYEESHTAKRYRQVTQEDLVRFGFIPEFAGRIPIVATLTSLSEEELIRILEEPHESIIKQYQTLFEIDDVVLTFSKDALHYIAEEALKRQAGARGLRSIIEETMYDIMFDLPNKRGETIEITKADLCRHQIAK